MRPLALLLLVGSLLVAATVVPTTAAADRGDGLPHSCKRVKALGGVYQVRVLKTRCDNARRWTRKMLRSNFEPRGWSYCGDSRQRGYCSVRKGKAKYFRFERIKG